jgi:hypothetical protein
MLATARREVQMVEVEWDGSETESDESNERPPLPSSLSSPGPLDHMAREEALGGRRGQGP